LDVVGIVLALVGLLTLLSLLSSNQGSVTSLWLSTLYKVSGWGTFVLPIALLLVGLWLVFRNIERLPQLSAERLIGIILLYLNLLTLLHLAGGGGWPLAEAGQGGGYIGGAFEHLLITGLGSAGGWIVWTAWFLLAIAFTLDISLSDLFTFFQRVFMGIKNSLVARREAAAQGAALSTAEPVERLILPGQPSDLPAEFRPLPASNVGAAAVSRTASPRQPSVSAVNSATPDLAEPAAGQSAVAAVVTTEPEPAAPAPVYTLPTTEAILDPAEIVFAQANIDTERSRIIVETLASFGAPSHIVEVHRGPTVTQYGVEPDFIESRGGKTRVRVSKIVSLADDLALALAAQRIRIQAPVPGRNYVGIEVPNAEIARVMLREVIESEAFQKLKSPLRFAVGKDVAGKPVAYDLASMPHLLIAGATGSGKSVCVNAILACLLMNNTPNDLRLVLVDPKRVELTGYNGIPHLLIPVIVDADRVVGALQWIQREMDNRYHKFAQHGVRNIQEYNTRQSAEHLPYLVIVIDELADLMMLAPDETERSITRLAQLARATGIHLIIATQRPSVDVVTGLIKANFPARIAFAVASGIDSRVILDQPGAERLLGRGDMLFQAPDAAAPVRLQGVFVGDSEIQRLVDYWHMAIPETAGPVDPNLPADSLPRGVPLVQASLWESMKADSDADPMLQEAVDLVRREGRASITMLQRRLRIGYTRAARLIDTLEERGIVGPPQAATQVREVLDYGTAGPPAED